MQEILLILIWILVTLSIVSIIVLLSKKYGFELISVILASLVVISNILANKIVLFGTGQPLRQFMHSDNLAFIIKHCLDNDIYTNMHVASEDSLTIKELAEIALKACDAENLTIQFDSSYPDGQYRKDVSIELLKNTIPEFKTTDLYTGIKNTYAYLTENNII